jgi:Ca-activated chloride channel family protein
MSPFAKLSTTVLAATLVVLLGATARSQPKEFEDRTLSPYFFVKSDDPEVDQLPLKSTSAEVNISGVIADVQVIQIYKNEGKRPLEAIYVFPASTKAAVYGMQMTIGERVINAEINKREDARRQYQQAKQQGKSASLLEQHRPNVFQMNVANIMPGDEIKVELKYTELQVPTDKVYEFVYPTVVGPRYTEQQASTTPPWERWMENPYLHQGEAPRYTFDITVTLAGGLPIKEVSSPSHQVTAAYDGPTLATIKLDKSERYGGNRDYILRYRLAGKRIESGLLLYEGKEENFFLLMMQPPQRVTKRDIPGREYVFIVDVSGSMRGFPLNISKRLLKDLIGNLRSSDRFNVLLFAGGSRVLSERPIPATPANIQKAVHLIERQRGGGGTRLLPAFQRALALEKPEGYSRTIVIATDGYVTVEEEVFDLIRNNLDDANVFAFGIGRSVNRHIIEGMARVGMGEPFIITKPEEAPTKASRFRTLIQSPVLTDVKVEFDGFTSYAVEPVTIPDVLADRPVILFGKWRGHPRGKITLSGITGNGRYRDVIDVHKVEPLKGNSALRYLWARHRIAMLSDYNKLRPNDKRIQEVTELGLTYNLLTAYTSFVAVDTQVRNQTGNVTTVKQPLPLPQGVSDYAVGRASAAQAPSSPMAYKTMPQPTEEPIARDRAEGKSSANQPPRLGEFSMSGGLREDKVETEARRKLADIRACKLDNKAKGKLILELTISPNGQIKTVKVLSTPFKDKKGQRCIIDYIKRWRFPAPENSQEAKATLTLLFGGK